MGLIKSSMGTFIARGIGAVCVLLQGMILLRFLGPEQQGIYALSILIPSFFFQFFNFSLEAPLISYLKLKKYHPFSFISSLTLVGLISGIIGYNLMLGFIFFCNNLIYPQFNPSYFLITMAILPALLITYYYKSIMRASLHIKQFNIVDIAPKLLFLIVLLILISIYKLTVFEAIGTWIISNISSLILGIYFILKNKHNYKNISHNTFLKLIKDGMKLHIGAITNILITRLDLIIINYYLSPADVGIYFVSITLAELIWFISSAVELTLHPFISNNPQEVDAIQKTTLVCRHVFYWSISIALIIGLFSTTLIKIYGGPEYLTAATALLIVLPGRLVFVIPKILTALWIRRQYFNMLTIISVICVSTNIILNILLVPSHGIIGAAIASSITYLVICLITLVTYYLLIDKNILNLFKINYADIQIYLTTIKKLISKYKQFPTNHR